ncbi:alpha/beta fold hydrolase [Solimonas sp. K1W22B-7]|uniref:alpha/beta fold hydrolase n=1 Tax=Solimonas sp. K1W22B-7 TaxID=2303331 RepID=UPI000E32D4C8|nr:alpha/beta fold hydrolase [Solimonas sp. K1W22B-7]AXQ27800.1 alpha/beta fold hydrolase [Solimonas sp. K1W22B-7]
MNDLKLQDRYIPTVLGRLRLRLRVAGQGPAILFWPSLLMDGSMWLAQARHFAAGHTVILVDSPGHGGSEALTRRFTFEECARCIVQVLDALGIGKTHIVGNSWGGMIGGTFAALYPERIGAAVLMNATASRAGLRQRLEFRLLTEVVRKLGAFRGPFVARAIKAFIGPTTARERPGVAEAIREALGRLNAESVYWAVNSVVPARPDQRKLFGRIRTPVLVLAGIEDPTFPVPETTEMAKAIPGAEFLVMDGTGHLAGLERPEEVNRIIEGFLARNG